jgi:predicted transcriptional regulator of viral defense system
MKEKKKKTSGSLKVFKLKEALDVGLTRRTILKKVLNGEFLKLSHGVYLNLEADLPVDYIDFIAAISKFGENSVIGGLTALYYHNLIEQVPQQVWVIVPQNTRTTEKKYRLIRSKKTSGYGIEHHKEFRICDIDRSIAEAFKYSSKIGIRVAISATVRAIKDKKTTLTEIMKAARKLNYEKSIKKHWETIVGVLEI